MSVVSQAYTKLIGDVERDLIKIRLDSRKFIKEQSMLAERINELNSEFNEAIENRVAALRTLEAMNSRSTGLAMELGNIDRDIKMNQSTSEDIDSAMKNTKILLDSAILDISSSEFDKNTEALVEEQRVLIARKYRTEAKLRGLHRARDGAVLGLKHVDSTRDNALECLKSSEELESSIQSQILNSTQLLDSVRCSVREFRVREATAIESRNSLETNQRMLKRMQSVFESEGRSTDHVLIEQCFILSEVCPNDSELGFLYLSGDVLLWQGRHGSLVCIDSEKLLNAIHVEEPGSSIVWVSIAPGTNDLTAPSRHYNSGANVGFPVDQSNRSMFLYLLKCILKGANRTLTSSKSMKIFNLVGIPKLCNEMMFHELFHSIPYQYRNDQWTRVYSNSGGNGLLPMLRVLRENWVEASLIIVKDTKDSVFGGFVCAPWVCQKSSFGSSQSFVFKLTPYLTVYSSSQKNSSFQLCFPGFIAMGVGAYALRLDDRLCHGYSGECSTFDSPTLSSTVEFEIDSIEVWGVSIKPGHIGESR